MEGSHWMAHPANASSCSKILESFSLPAISSSSISYTLVLMLNCWMLTGFYVLPDWSQSRLIFCLQQKVIRHQPTQMLSKSHISKGFRNNLALISTSLNHGWTGSAAPRWCQVWNKWWFNTCVNTFSTRRWLTKEVWCISVICDAQMMTMTRHTSCFQRKLTGGSKPKAIFRAQTSWFTLYNSQTQNNGLGWLCGIKFQTYGSGLNEKKRHCKLLLFL